jgi:hypothetical protein
MTGKARWCRRSVRERLELGEREMRAARGAVKLGEIARPLEGSVEHRGEVVGEVNASVNVFNDIEDNRLDERLRRGIKGGEMNSRW